MLGKRQQHVIVGGPGNAREIGEHESLAQLQRAKRDRERAKRAAAEAERLEVEANEAYTQARLEVRRIAER